jgi:hypothetical protein
MPLARHPDPDEVDCLIRNGELRTAIEPYLDESVWEVDFRSLSTEAENRFLESMLAWELAPLSPVARWFTPQLALQPACTLDDTQLHERLWHTIDALYEKRIVLDFTDHLSDRDLYALIRRDILPAKIKQVDLPDNYVHWDCSATTDDLARLLRQRRGTRGVASGGGPRPARQAGSGLPAGAPGRPLSGPARAAAGKTSPRPGPHGRFTGPRPAPMLPTVPLRIPPWRPPCAPCRVRSPSPA